MIYAKIPCQDGVPITQKRIISAVSISETQAIACIDTESAEDDWEIVSESDYLSYIGLPSPSPDQTKVIGQFVVQQMLKNAELQQRLDIIGKSIVQLMLKG